MYSAFKIYFRIAWACKTPLVFLLDKEYRPVPEDILKNISVQIKNQFEYINEISDCDDASFLFKAAASEKKENGVGIIWGTTPRGRHLWSVAICEDGIHEVEPQNAKIGKRKGFKPWVVVI